MDRREFFSTGAALALSGAGGYAAQLAGQKPRRVGLIGCGWYGKCDIVRMMQVAPVEVVSLCDVDKQMLAGAADMVAGRQASKKRPRTYGDYREMLKQKDLDIVLVETPDHWHALAMIAAVKSGADVWVQKPISVDIVEGQAMVAAARKYNRVVQVHTQRRSTPHIVEARDRFVNTGLLGKIALVEICCYSRRGQDNPPDTPPPEYLDYEMWTGPAPMRPYSAMTHPRQWRAFMEYGNGILGDMAIHMFDMVRWMLGLGWPKSVASTGGILVQKQSKSNISDTQTATFDYNDVRVVWQHRLWGAAPDPKYTWAAIFYGEKGTLKVGLNSYDFIPQKGEPVHGDVLYELEQYPEDKTEERLEKHVAPAIRRHMVNFLQAVDTRSKPVADIEQGYISTACCILANLAMQTERTLAWDVEKQRIAGDEEANRLLRRPYRKPWVHPEPSQV
jgi:predicted dehydrogenase